MARHANEPRIDELYELVKAHPGRSAAWYSARMGLDSKEVYRLLLSAERIGPMFAEGRRGRLYPFE